MGLIRGLGTIVIAASKVFILPISLLFDIIDMLAGQYPETTSKLIDSIFSDIKNAIDDII